MVNKFKIILIEIHFQINACHAVVMIGRPSSFDNIVDSFLRDNRDREMSYLVYYVKMNSLNYIDLCEDKSTNSYVSVVYRLKTLACEDLEHNI